MSKHRLYLLPAVAIALMLAFAATMTRGFPVANAASHVTLSVAHFAPFADSVEDTSVTVRVNGGDLITEFVFSEVASQIIVPSGVYTIEIIPTGSVTPALTSAPIGLMADTEYFVAAVGGANGYDLGLYPVVVETTPSTTSAKLRVSHLAPFASPESATAVDICTADNAPVIQGLTYLSSTEYLELPPAVYDLKIAVSGSDCETVALDLAPFRLRAGQIVDVFARGLLPASAASVALDPELELGVYVMGPGNVSVAHFAPFAATITETAVTVRVDGVDLLTDFTFPSITPYVSLPMGDHYVEIIPAGGSDPVITGTLTVDPLTDYTVAAIGFITDDADLGLGLQLFVDDNASQPPAGQARVRAAHLAPFADTLDGTRVDLCTTPNGAPVLDDVPYKASATLNLPEGILPTYLSAPEPDCGPSLFNLPIVSLGEGDIVYLYVVGGRNGLPLQVASPGVNVAEASYLPTIQNNEPVQ